MASSSNLFAMLQKEMIKAKVSAPANAAAAFFKYLFSARYKKSTAREANTAESRFNLYARSFIGINVKSFAKIENEGYPVGARTSIFGTCTANQLVSPPTSFVSRVLIYKIKGIKKAGTANIAGRYPDTFLVREYLSEDCVILKTIYK